MNQIIPRHRFLILAIACFVVLAGCKSRQPRVTDYKYLTEDKLSDKEDKGDKEDRTVITELKQVLDEADDYLGTPYRYGGINKNGIDCSGLTRNAYRVAGVELPRSAFDQSQRGEKVARAEVKEGDLVFFSSNNTKKVDHVGMVVKVDGESVTFIHASTSKGVRHDQMNEGYWKNLFRDARRVTLP